MTIATYKQRWQIGTYSKVMKSSEFNIEDTHLRDIKCIVYDNDGLSYVSIVVSR